MIHSSAGDSHRLLCLLVSTAALGCTSGVQARYDDARADLAATPSSPPATRELDLGDEALDRAALIEAVLARNPGLDAARAAWRAALAEVPQLDTLPDPSVDYSFAPLSIGSSDVDYGQVISIGQTLPWPGKIDLRSRVAVAEAEAVAAGYDEARLRLALAASLLFDDLFATVRSLEVTEEHAALLADVRAVAEAQYAAGRGAQQDVLQAEVELAHVEHDGVVLAARRDVLVARLNGLLHRAPDAPLPPPPAELAAAAHDSPTLDALIEIALERRPDLSTRRARIEAREVGVKLADREGYPDLRVMGSYDSMWAMPEHRWMIGVGLELPIWRGSRRAAVDEAEARLLGGEADLEATAAEIRVEVATALARLEEAHHVARLYRDRLVAASEAQVDAARVGYETGSNDFQTLIEAERGLLQIRLDAVLAVAQVSQRRAELQRATGQVPGLEVQP